MIVARSSALGTYKTPIRTITVAIARSEWISSRPQPGLEASAVQPVESELSLAGEYTTTRSRSEGFEHNPPESGAGARTAVCFKKKATGCCSTHPGLRRVDRAELPGHGELVPVTAVGGP
jgi:hypothetical protein